MNVSITITKNYEPQKIELGTCTPRAYLVKTNPIKPNFKGTKMLLRLFTFVFTRAFLLSHYLVEFCRGDDRMSLFKMQGYESCIWQ